MPHVRENEPRPDGVQPREKTPGPDREPTGDLGGHPVNPSETAPREAVPDPGGDTQPSERHPEAVEGEPGSDL